MVRTHQWRALGTYAQLVVEDGGDELAALALAQQLVRDIDLACSRFRADSDLVRANRAAGEWVRVSPLLVSAVAAAVDAARATNGLVDPTLGRQLVAAGYDADLAAVRTRDHTGLTAHAEPHRRSAYTELESDPTGWIKVPVGVALDLGATGKAFAADLVADAIVARLGCSTVVSLGGDVAGRCRPEQGGWMVLVSDNEGGDLEAPGELVRLPGNRGLATSSVRHRRWRIGDGEMHHIIDPRIGAPAVTTIMSASVHAGSCVEANAASTAAIILGDAAVGWLERRGIGALLVRADGTRETTAGWSITREVATAC